MALIDAKLNQINSILGGGISTLMKDIECRFFFESNGEAKRSDKERKPCLIYIIGDSLLICRPRRYGKKYYVKYQLQINKTHIDTDLEENGENQAMASTSKKQQIVPVILSTRNGTNTQARYYIWFPSNAINVLFYSKYDECYKSIVCKDAVKTYWNPFPHPFHYSYHNELLQRYSVVKVSEAGYSDVNGTYYPVGILNGSLVWQNNQNVYLSRECISNSLGWVFGNMQQCYYGLEASSLFPPSDEIWKVYSGKKPAPQVIVVQSGECASLHKLKNELKVGQSGIKWTPELKQRVLFSICEEFYFSELDYNHNLHLMLDAYYRGLQELAMKMSTSDTLSTSSSHDEPKSRHYNMCITSLFKSRSTSMDGSISNSMPASPDTMDVSSATLPSPGSSEDCAQLASIEAIFGRIPTMASESDQILERLKEMEYNELEGEEATARIINLLIEKNSYIKEYASYAEGLKKAFSQLEILMENETIEYFVSKTRDSIEMRGQSIKSCLFLPVERIMYYECMIGNLIPHIPRNQTLYYQTNQLYKSILSIFDKMRCSLHSLPFSPPIDTAIALSVPLAILWDEENRFYGSFDMIIGSSDEFYLLIWYIGYRHEIETIGTVEGIKGQLFIFDSFCYFAIPNLVRRNGQFTILFHFCMSLLSLESGSSGNAVVFVIPVDIKNKVATEEYMLVFDSLSDKTACINTINMIKQNHSSLSSTTSKAENPTIVLEPKLEDALNPALSPFASPNDYLAMQRLAIYREFLYSEQCYISDLAIIREVYKKPLVKDLKKKEFYVSEAEIDMIFGNIEEIERIHMDFYYYVSTHLSDMPLSQLISREFLKTSNRFFLYTNYCNNYYKALNLLQSLTVEREGLEVYLQMLSYDPRCNHLDIFSYLIKPIQRICKYPLFFHRLLSKMESNHPFHSDMESLNNRIVGIVTDINTKMSEIESYNALLSVCNSITPPQKEIVQLGRNWNGKGKKDVSIIILSDMLLVTQSTGGLFTIKKQKILLYTIAIKEYTLQEEPKEISCNVYLVNQDEELYCIHCNSMQDKEFLVKDYSQLREKVSMNAEPHVPHHPRLSDTHMNMKWVCLFSWYNWVNELIGSLIGLLKYYQ